MAGDIAGQELSDQGAKTSKLANGDVEIGSLGSSPSA